MHGSSKWFVMLGATLLGLAIMASTPAQPPAPPSDDEVNAIAHQLYCPVCENVPLDVCPTAACAQWRATIRDKLAAGWSESQIKDYFVEQYGARVLATPPARGLNWLVYVLPPAAFLAGAFVLYRAFRSWSKPVEVPGSDDKTSSDDPYVALLEEELRHRS
jgi:cytochrome c-type biogenesis protein CcmH